MKEIMKNTAIGVGTATAIFCVVGVVFDVLYGGNFSLSNYGFTKMSVGCLIVGMGFGIPSVVYKKDSIPRPVQMLIHMGTGWIVYTAVAFSVGWIPTELGIAKSILIWLGQIGIAFVIWLFFYIHYRNEAKRINEKIRQMYS